MEPSFQRSVSILLGFGSLLFLVAAFLPYSKVFVEPVAEKKLEIILRMKNMWIFGHILFGLGSIITVVAFGIQSYGLKEIANSMWSHLGVILMSLGAVLWCWTVVERIINPEDFAYGRNTPFMFPAYSLLTQLGLVFIGIMLLKASVANWIAWMFIVGSAVLFLLMVIFKDMPPFVYYVLTIVAAVALYFES
jgi:hypothetical protein